MEVALNFVEVQTSILYWQMLSWLQFMQELYALEEICKYKMTARTISPRGKKGIEISEAAVLDQLRCLLLVATKTQV